MVPVLILAYLQFCPIPVLARYITGTAITWCPYQYWRFGTFVRYQYWHGTLLVLALNGESTGIGIFALLSNTIIGTVHYQYCHCLVLVMVLAFWYFSSKSVLAWPIAGTGI
jgi:hypothetical protein